jgi:hypothetical protein
LPCRSDADPDRLFCQLRNESGKQEPVYRWIGLLIRSSFACSQDAAGRQDKIWLTEEYTDPADEDRKRRQALRVLTAFFPVSQSTWQQTVYAEHLINTKLDGIPFTGIVDRINDSSFRPTISARTSRRKWTKAQKTVLPSPERFWQQLPTGYFRVISLANVAASVFRATTETSVLCSATPSPAFHRSQTAPATRHAGRGRYRSVSSSCYIFDLSKSPRRWTPSVMCSGSTAEKFNRIWQLSFRRG